MSEPKNAAEPAAPASGADGDNAPSSPAPSKGSHEFANPTINIIGTLSRQTSISALSAVSREGTPPPLPPRPQRLSSLLDSRPSTPSSNAAFPARPSLLSKATTQLSLAGSHDLAGEARSESPSSSGPSRASRAKTYSGLGVGNGSGSGSAESAYAEADAYDSTSIHSNAPTDAGITMEAESIIGDVLPERQKSLLQNIGRRSLRPGHRFQDKENESLFAVDEDMEAVFAREFDEVDEMTEGNEEIILSKWRAKLKHFLILSSAGKPIYSRHGDDQLITNYIGIIQTIISFYQSTSDTLKGFTAGNVRFVILSKGPLNLVAITKLPESDSQLRAQLDALYMQILSTLTLPSMEKMFAARANYDLRRPLQGTETLLSALADGFTRGSPSTLLSSLECLRLRKSHRNIINNTLLKTRSPNLLYGLLVASGKLVSVVRPKKHSLHPGDLHLIFNMLFEAGSVKAGGGENWIPLCLPGFNNTGFLYMYVSFLNLERPGEVVEERPKSREGGTDEVAIVLISANKESFFELRGMRDELVEQLQSNGSTRILRQAVHAGRPKCTDIVPGTVLRHFLYKSRGNVQFVMPAFGAGISGAWERRRLLNLYATLHTALHAKSPTSLKIHHQTSTTYIALAWMTPLFEMYAVAPGSTSRQALAQAANRLVEWVKKEEERVFIIGGAVF